MQPLSTAEREAMKRNGRGVTDADIDEYEGLLIRRQRARSAFAARDLVEAGERSRGRIEELYRKLYGANPGDDARAAADR